MQNILTGLIVALALAWMVRAFWRSAGGRGGGGGGCGGCTLCGDDPKDSGKTEDQDGSEGDTKKECGKVGR